MSDVIQAAFQSAINAENSSIVYLPEGKHKISATKGGKPVTLDVTVDESIFAQFNTDLQSRLAENVRPFAGFDHEKGAASFIPKEFRYEVGTGLVLDVEWTSAGRNAIDGKDYSYFSPTFLIGKDGKPKSIAPRGEIGSLVNDPAFEAIPRIAAAYSQPNETMIDTLIELGLVEAGHDPETAIEAAKNNLATLREQAAEADKVEANRASIATELETIKASKAEIETELATLKVEAAKNADAECEKVIADAVACGRIEPKNEAALKFWKESIKADRANIEILNSLPTKKALETETILAGRKEDAPELKGMDKVQAAFAQELNPAK
jgi:phage I-like protein